jgi:hypothetical protein
MGFRCPICQKDFGRNRDDWQEHCKLCCDGAAADVVKVITQAAEGTEQQVQADSSTNSLT